MRKSKLGDKYTDELIIARGEEIGYSVTSITRDEVIPFVHMVCKCGAKRTSKASSMQNAKCLYCEGKRNRKEDVLAKLDSEGYTLVGELEESEDSYGNKFVKVASRINVTCKLGHNRSITVFELYTKPECNACANKSINAGFSRSEEIIHRFLDYHNIEHIRQYKLPEEYESLRLDFYLPEHNMIIEYDGEQHKYGRSDGTKEDLIETQRRDSIRDKYASDNDIRMARIDGSVAGKEIMYILHMVFADSINKYNINDPYYDEIVRDIFDECSKQFGWLSYDEVKESANIRKNHTWDEINRMKGRSVAVTNRHFRIIYGMTKENYYGNI